MSGEKGDIRHSSAAVAIILLLIFAVAVTVRFRLPTIKETLRSEEHIALYREEKSASVAYPVFLHSSSSPVLTERIIRKPLTGDDLHLAMEALLLPETEEEISKGLISYIPDGTSLIGIAVCHDYVFIDFSEELENAPDKAFEEIALTAKANTGAKHVCIMIENHLIEDNVDAYTSMPVPE